MSDALEIFFKNRASSSGQPSTKRNALHRTTSSLDLGQKRSLTHFSNKGSHDLPHLLSASMSTTNLNVGGSATRSYNIPSMSSTSNRPSMDQSFNNTASISSVQSAPIRASGFGQENSPNSIGFYMLPWPMSLSQSFVNEPAALLQQHYLHMQNQQRSGDALSMGIIHPDYNRNGEQRIHQMNADKSIKQKDASNTGKAKEASITAAPPVPPIPARFREKANAHFAQKPSLEKIVQMSDSEDDESPRSSISSSGYECGSADPRTVITTFRDIYLVKGGASYLKRGMFVSSVVNREANKSTDFTKLMKWQQTEVSNKRRIFPNDPVDEWEMRFGDVFAIIEMYNDNWASALCLSTPADTDSKLIKFIPLSGVTSLAGFPEYMLSLRVLVDGRLQPPNADYVAPPRSSSLVAPGGAACSIKLLIEDLSYDLFQKMIPGFSETQHYGILDKLDRVNRRKKMSKPAPHRDETLKKPLKGILKKPKVEPVHPVPTIRIVSPEGKNKESATSHANFPRTTKFEEDVPIIDADEDSDDEADIDRKLTPSEVSALKAASNRKFVITPGYLEVHEEDTREDSSQLQVNESKTDRDGEGKGGSPGKDQKKTSKLKKFLTKRFTKKSKPDTRNEKGGGSKITAPEQPDLGESGDLKSKPKEKVEKNKSAFKSFVKNVFKRNKKESATSHSTMSKDLQDEVNEESTDKLIVVEKTINVQFTNKPTVIEKTVNEQSSDNLKVTRKTFNDIPIDKNVTDNKEEITENFSLIEDATSPTKLGDITSRPVSKQYIHMHEEDSEEDEELTTPKPLPKIETSVADISDANNEQEEEDEAEEEIPTLNSLLEMESSTIDVSDVNKDQEEVDEISTSNLLPEMESSIDVSDAHSEKEQEEEADFNGLDNDYSDFIDSPPRVYERPQSRIGQYDFFPHRPSASIHSDSEEENYEPPDWNLVGISPDNSLDDSLNNIKTEIDSLRKATAEKILPVSGLSIIHEDLHCLGRDKPLPPDPVEF